MGLWPPAAGGPARRPWGLPQPRATGSSGAKLPLRVSLEDFDYSAHRSITKAQIRELQNLGWLREGRPLLLIGQTGVGK